MTLRPNADLAKHKSQNGMFILPFNAISLGMPSTEITFVVCAPHLQ
jgi:hypothetical protein